MESTATTILHCFLLTAKKNFKTAMTNFQLCAFNLLYICKWLFSQKEKKSKKLNKKTQKTKKENCTAKTSGLQPTFVYDNRKNLNKHTPKHFYFLL